MYPLLPVDLTNGTAEAIVYLVAIIAAMCSFMLTARG